MNITIAGDLELMKKAKKYKKNLIKIRSNQADFSFKTICESVANQTNFQDFTTL
jgi:hypothetical protein